MKEIASACLLVASATAATASATQREQRYRIDIAAGDRTDALTTLAAQAGISFGMDGPVPGGSVKRLRGRMTAEQALRKILQGTRLVAVPVGLRTFRLALRARTADGAKAAPLEDIVVTARKLPEALSDIPAPISVYRPDDRRRAGVANTAGNVAAEVDGMALSARGPARDRIFLRAIADSPFDGFSQSTVAVQVDDARITYDASEPGLRLVDIDHVEILKGPQGPLYGTGALGGVYRVVTRRPVLGANEGSAGFGLSSIQGGGLGGEAQGVLNLSLASDVAAVRLVGYSAVDGGWISDTAGARNVNLTSTYGARAALRVTPVPGWTVDVSGALQGIRANDSQYVDRDADALTRTLAIREPRASDFRLAQTTVSGSIGTLSLTIAASQAWQDQTDRYAVGAMAGALGDPQATLFDDRRNYRVFDQEVRLASAPGALVPWVAGASYLSATTRATGNLAGPSGAGSTVFLLHRAVTEAALFGDASFPIVGRLRGNAGIRVFRAATDDERDEGQTVTTTARVAIGVTPSVSLIYPAGRSASVYLRFATAFRPGGLDPANTATGRYDADEVRSFDLGTRLSTPDGRVAITAGAFRSAWLHVQSDYLQLDGLIATRNAGDADILGGEAAIDWRPRRGPRIRLGATWQRGRLTRAVDGGDLPDDRRLPVVPDISGHAQIEQGIDWRGATLTPFLAAMFTGASRLSFDDGLDRHTPGYAAVDGGLSVAVGETIGRLNIDNLLDTRADTFAFGNPFSIRSGAQFTPLRPRRITVSIARQF